jgi:hypothetical protein
MTNRTFDLPAEVQSTLTYRGADGARWLSELPRFVRDLEREWNITVGAVVHGGSEARLPARRLPTAATRSSDRRARADRFEQEVHAAARSWSRLRDCCDTTQIAAYAAGAKRPPLNSWLCRYEINRSDLHDDAETWIKVPDDLPLLNGSKGAQPG